MSSCTRSLRAAQTFTASSIKQPVRRLHITGAKEQPSAYLKSATASTQTKAPKTEPTRAFNTSRVLKRPNDSSTVDFAFFPAEANFAAGTVSTMSMNIPILPDNYRQSFIAQVPEPQVAADVMPAVNTVSMSVPGQVAVLSESDVGATHEGREMDVFSMVETVSRKVESAKKSAEKEVSMFNEVVAGMFSDLVGGRSKTA